MSTENPNNPIEEPSALKLFPNLNIVTASTSKRVYFSVPCSGKVIQAVKQ